MNSSNSIQENSTTTNTKVGLLPAKSNKFFIAIGLLFAITLIIAGVVVYLALKNNANNVISTSQTSNNSNQYGSVNSSDLVALSNSSSISSSFNSSSLPITFFSSSSNSSIEAQSSSTSSTSQTGLNLTLDARVKFYGSTTNFILTSGNFLDSNYKITDISNTHTIAYLVSDSKLHAEFALPYESGPGSPKVINIVDLGNVAGIGDIKRFNYESNVYDASTKLYTNQQINYAYNSEGAPNPPTVTASIVDSTSDTNTVFPSCKPLVGSDFTNCDNLIKSLKFTTNTKK